MQEYICYGKIYIKSGVTDMHVKVAAATPKIQVANCDYNADRIIELMERAQEDSVQLLCLPELCITGSTCGDLFLQPVLIDSAKAALQKLLDASLDINMVIVVGLPLEYDEKLYSFAAVFSRRQLLGLVPKTIAYNHFDAYRWREKLTFQWQNNDIPMGVDMLFEISPGINLGVRVDEYQGVTGANIVAAITAAQERVGLAHHRRRVAKIHSRTCGYVRANAGYGESTTDKVFSGHNIIAHGGEILHESLPFGDGWVVADIKIAAKINAPPQTTLIKATHSCITESTITKGSMQLPTMQEPSPYSCSLTDPHPFITVCSNPAEALNIQAAALAKRLQHTNSQTAVIGISGGLDSCLALLVTVRAFAFINKPVSEIAAVTLPCFGTTAQTKSNAHALCNALGITCREIDITVSVTAHLQEIDHPLNKHDTVYENAQARMRTMVLMNLANQQNGIVIGTGSLSELALGWATYNGDHMSMYAVNAGVPKTLVRHLVEYVAENPERLLPPTQLQTTTSIGEVYDLPPQSVAALKKVLENILATKVTPELLPTPQNTEDLIGPYELHDFFIYHMLVKYRHPEEIFTQAKSAFPKYSPEEILRRLKTFYKRFFSQQFKRSCLPDGPQVVNISLSPRTGFKMPSDASAAAWLTRIDAISP